MQREYIKPQRLKTGDTVAVVSPSWSGPAHFPVVYENGLSILRKWGLRVVEFPTTRTQSNPSLNHAKQRANDINSAFADKHIKAIFTSIGGDDSIRLLPFLDSDLIRSNPKILMGFSDVTTLTTFVNQLGIVTFNGPTVMAGLSQMNALPSIYEDHIHEVLFSPRPNYTLPIYRTYCEGYPDWIENGNVGKVNPLLHDRGMTVLQGKGVVKGTLFGGCIEVLDFMQGTRFWPDVSFWQNKLLFLETSEEKPSAHQIQRILRTFGVQGIFEQVNALLFARPRGFTDDEKKQLNNIIRSVIQVEFAIDSLPIMVNCEFGHTDPQIIMPNGICTEVNFEKETIRLLEPCVA
jgi:muramoyltetrapeptide carboxypeptidase LdcA involved in peptidoglycan recycling